MSDETTPQGEARPGAGGGAVETVDNLHLPWTMRPLDARYQYLDHVVRDARGCLVAQTTTMTDALRIVMVSTRARAAPPAPAPCTVCGRPTGGCCTLPKPDGLPLIVGPDGRPPAPAPAGAPDA